MYCLISVLLLAEPVSAIERLKLATQEWPPYQTLQNGVMGGVVMDRVKCTLRNMGQPYELHMTSWDKAQLLVETNQMDGFFSGSANSARARFAVPSAPVISDMLYWFISPSADIEMGTEAVKYQARFGAKFNTSKWLYLKKNGYNVVKKPTTADNVVQMLWQREIDVALEYELVFESSMKKLGVPMDFFKRTALREKSLSVHFSKTFLKLNPLFLATFNRMLAGCIKENR
jgi:polar amino acid transport system substrate-binding protein